MTSNPFAGLINAEFKAIYNNAISALLEDTALTLPCRFVYEGTKKVKCNNCVFNQKTGKSNGVYLAGGPKSFVTGLCPVCNGDGIIITNSEEEGIYLAVIYNNKKWININNSAILTPENYVQILASITLLPKMEKATYIIINTDIEGYTRQRYVIDGKVQPVGLGDNSFCVSMWKKSG